MSLPLIPLIGYFNRYWMTTVNWSLWNHRFNRLVAKFHPNVWHLFDQRTIGLDEFLEGLSLLVRAKP